MGGRSVAAQDTATDVDQPAMDLIDASDIQSVMTDEPDFEPTKDEPTGIDLLSLIARGGRFMIPIGLMSMLVVTLSVERMLSLRSEKIMPTELLRQIGEVAVPHERFPPEKVLEFCQDSPSPTSRVVSSMMTRTGQPLGEVERAASESIQREVDRYARPVRWLSLAAAATPLMGLLGTVWGMIVAFHESSTLTADRSRSEQLSEGIYTALVTTLAGLAVAIPAAILAQYLENRIARLFSRIEELAFSITPGLLRFVGRQRLDERGELQPLDSPLMTTATSSTPVPPITAPGQSNPVDHPVPPPVAEVR
ncbi:MAG: MotA/TolQ/ExbB proton channel family protein [Planctomycetota bacterium]